jgi:hypothetical protein
LRPKVFFKDAPAPEQIAVQAAIMLQRLVNRRLGQSLLRAFSRWSGAILPFLKSPLTPTIEG